MSAPTMPAPAVEMDADDLIPTNLVIAEEKSEEEQARLSKQKLVEGLSFSFPGSSLSSALSQVTQPAAVAIVVSHNASLFTLSLSVPGQD